MSTHKAIRGGGLVDDTAFVHESVYVAGTASVGARTYIGQGAYISAGVAVGTDCIICDRVRVIADVPDGTTIECDCCSGGGGGGSSVLEFDSVETVGTKLASYDTTGKLKGTLAWVGNDTFPNQNSVHDYFTLVYGENLTVPAYGYEVVNSPTFAMDGAQWKRNHTPNEQALQKQFWAIDPQNVSTLASDENTGWGDTEVEADAHPILSMQELNARLAGYQSDIPLVLHFLSEPNNNSFRVLDSLQGAGPNQYVTVKGNLVDVNGTSSHRSVTAVQVAVPATNTERTITIGGFDDVAAFVGFMVQTIDGGKTAFVTHKVSANVLAITQPRSSNIDGTYGSVVDFADTDIVSFYDCTPMPDWPFPDTGCTYPLLAWVRLDASRAGSFIHGQMGDSNPTIIQCFFGDYTKPSVGSYALTYNGAAATVVSCLEAGQHANAIYNGSWNFISHSVMIGADGPQVAGANFNFYDELNIYGVSGSPGYRQLPGLPFTVFFEGDTNATIATFGQMSSAFDMWQPNHAATGNFVARPGTSPVKWYGVVTPTGIPGVLGLLTLGAGTKSQLPYSAGLTVTNGGVKPVVVDGADFDFADVPINTLSGATLAG